VERDIWLLNEEGLDGRSLFDVRLIGAGPFEFYLLSNMVHVRAAYINENRQLRIRSPPYDD